MISNFYQKIRSLLPNSSHLQTAVLNFGARVVLTTVVITAMLTGLRQIGILEAIELEAFDQMIRLRPDESPDERLLVVAITEKDIKKIQEETISDQNLNQLLGKLEEYQPLLIGLDIFRDIPIGSGRADLLKRLQQSDRLIPVCQTGDEANPGVPPPPGVPEDRVAFADQVIDLNGAIRRSLLFITPKESTAKNSSPVNANICDDSSTPLLSLSFQLAIRYLKMQGIQSEFTPTNEFKVGSKVFKRLEKNSGGYQNADVDGYQILLNYRSPKKPAKQVTLTDVLEGKIDPNWVKNRIVLVGYTAPSKKDDFQTPYSAVLQENFRMPGVVVHAQIVSQILSAVLNNRPLFWFWSEWGEVLWIAGWSLVGGILAWRIHHPIGFGLVGIVTLGGLFGISFIIFTQSGWIPIAAPALGLIATAASVVLADRFEKGGYAKKIKRGVQRFFKIEIDEEEKSRQLSEYEGMIDRVQQWQQQAQDLETQEAFPNLENVSQLSTEVDEASSPQPSSDSLELDYFEQLQQRVEALKNQEETIHKITLEISDTEIKILEIYCQKTGRNQGDVLQELIRSLQDK